MEAIVAALGAQQDDLDGLLRGLAEDGWHRPTRCPGWSVADVVLHLAQTDELALASGQGRFAEAARRFLGGGATVDDAAAEAVARERGAPGAEVHARWRAAAAAERALFGRCDARQRLMWVAGELPARTLATTRLAETWIHTGDVAGALGVALAPTDGLWHIARLAWRTLPYAFRRAGQELHGPVALDLEAPDGSAWRFGDDPHPATTVSGSALEFCLVAGQRAEPEHTGLTVAGVDGERVLALVRTYA